jgi:plasmid stabilization system protein ParE
VKPILVLRRAAVGDIEDAQLWYEGQEPGLGDRFLAAVERTLALVEKNPYVYQLVEDEIRRAVVRKFPYNVFYLPEVERVVVLAVFHQAMSPGRLASRR